jgi:Caspase domain
MKLSYNIENTVAILIGTGRYAKNDFMPIDPVKGNLKDLKNILLDKDIFGLPEDNIFVLEDKTNVEIVEALKEVLNEANLKTVFLYYSGHGQRTSKERLYLTAYNSVKDFDLIEYSGIEFSKLKHIIENCPGKPNSIVIIDACYSGIAAQNDSTLTDEERTINGAYIITSSSNKEQSFFDPNGKHTFFTDELIDILSNGSEKSDMLFSINDIYDNLQRRLRSKNLSQPQRRDNLDTENFYLAKNKKYNKEFFLRKAEQYFRDGNYSRALEYYYTLQERFDDTDYSVFIDKCRKEIDYSTLIMEADNLYNNKKYEQALVKYSEAKRLKSSSSLLFRINLCEEYIRMRKELIEEQQKEIEEEKLKAKKEAELKAKQEAELKSKQDAELNAKQEEEQKAKQEAESKSKREAELKSKQDAELKAKQEEEQKSKQEADLKSKQEEELKAKQEEELKAKQEEELKAKKEAELKEMQEAAELKARRKEELKRKESINAAGENINIETISETSIDPKLSEKRLNLFFRSVRDYKYSKFIAGFFGLIILGYIIFYSSEKSDVKEIEKNIIQQPAAFPFREKDSIKNEVSKYLLALYNRDYAYSDQNKISFASHDFTDVPVKYNPFEGDDYGSNKLSFTGINSDSLINSVYYSGFTLIGKEDSIEASLTARVDNSYSNLEIISVRYLEIIPLNNTMGTVTNEPQKIIQNKKRKDITKYNSNFNKDRGNERTSTKTSDDGPASGPVH